MDTRRLRLLLVAHLRGYMRPGSPPGLRALSREHLVVSAVAMENAAESRKLSTLAMAAACGGRGKVGELMKTLDEDIQDHKRLLDLDTGKESEAPKELAKLADLFTILKDADALKSLINEEK